MNSSYSPWERHSSTLDSISSAPSFGQSMSTIVDAPRPRLQRKASRPLWDVVQHATERRAATLISPLPIDSPSVDGDDEDIVTPREAVMPSSVPTFSPPPPSFSRRPLSQAAPSSPRTLARMPSLAEIKAKMNGYTPPPSSPSDSHRRPNGRSDSLDSNDSDGPQTPTEEWEFEFDAPAVAPRLAPFLRERTNGRLARPKSMPPVSIRTRQASLPCTPVRRPRPERTWTVDTYHKKSDSFPGSPTASEHSIVSSNFSLPIITCTPAGDEADSDNESEGDVIVFAGDEELLAEEHRERVEREFLGREMLFRLGRRGSGST